VDPAEPVGGSTAKPPTSNNNITNAAFLGNVGLDWQFKSTVPTKAALMMLLLLIFRLSVHISVEGLVAAARDAAKAEPLEPARGGGVALLRLGDHERQLRDADHGHDLEAGAMDGGGIFARLGQDLREGDHGAVRLDAEAAEADDPAVGQGGYAPDTVGQLLGDAGRQI
jgi:hypothetical protein